jgi:hypothetical protein
MSDIDRAFAALIYVFVLVATIPLWLLLGIWLMGPLERRLLERRKQRQSDRPEDS